MGKLGDTIGLIPRNNWDFGLRALSHAVSGALGRGASGSSLAEFYGVEPIFTNAGRTSLYAILTALDLPRGSAVGVPLFCCPVVFTAIRQAGLTPRFIDSGSAEHNLAPDDLRTKRDGLAALVAVHMFGVPADMDAIHSASDGVPVIEDCAQSFLSTYHGRQTGLLSTVGFLSFRCGKYVSAGGGSAILCADPELSERIRDVVQAFEAPSATSMVVDSAATFVKAALYNPPLYGTLGRPVGLRLDRRLNLTAKDGFAPGKIDASHLRLIEERVPGFQSKVDLQREHARVLLGEVKASGFRLPTEDQESSRNWFQFPLGFETSAQRDRMAEHLFRHGVDAAKYLDDIAEVAREQYGYTGDCPNAERLAKTTLLIPIHYNLSTPQIQHIVRAINDGAGASAEAESSQQETETEAVRCRASDD